MTLRIGYIKVPTPQGHSDSSLSTLRSSLFTFNLNERCLEVFEQRVLCILLAQQGLVGRYAPIDAETVVKDAYAAVGFGMVELVALVLENGRLAQHGETVGEAFWNEELAVVVLGQFDCYVLAVCRAALAYVDGNVENGSLNAAHQLGLGERRTLEMQAAHDAV